MNNRERIKIKQNNNDNPSQKFNNQYTQQSNQNLNLQNENIQQSYQIEQSQNQNIQQSIQIQQPQNQPSQMINEQIPQQQIPLQPYYVNQPYIIQQPYIQYNQSPPQNVIVVNQILPQLSPIRFSSIYPKCVVCPYCGQKRETKVKESFSICTCFYYIFIIIVFPLGILTCQFHNCSCQDCKDCCTCNCNCDKKCCYDGIHYCSNCGNYLGEYNSNKCDTNNYINL